MCVCARPSCALVHLPCLFVSVVVLTLREEVCVNVLFCVFPHVLLFLCDAGCAPLCVKMGS